MNEINFFSDSTLQQVADRICNIMNFTNWITDGDRINLGPSNNHWLRETAPGNFNLHFRYGLNDLAWNQLNYVLTDLK